MYEIWGQHRMEKEDINSEEEGGKRKTKYRKKNTRYIINNRRIST